MVKRTYFKTIWKTFTGNFSRFLVMSLIVMIGIAFVSGLGTLSISLTGSLEDYYKEKEGLDLMVKSTSMTGFSLDEINRISNIPGISDVKSLAVIDQEDHRTIFSDMSDSSFHRFTIISGRKIQSEHEILVDRISNVEIGECVTLFDQEYEVVGIVDNPSFYTIEQEKTIEEKDLNFVYYVDTNYCSLPIKYMITDLYIKLSSDVVSSDLFSDRYLEDVKKIAAEIKAIDEDVVVLTLEENLSYALTKNYGEKIDLVASVFPLFFMLVSCLVVYSIIHRLILEERSIIGCYRSLGISKFMIIFKYFLLTFFSCLIGAILGFLLGIYMIPAVVYPAYDAMFLMPSMTHVRVILPGIVMSIVVLLFISLITIFSVRSLFLEKPCSLLRPKVPSSGKKILLERIPFLWDHFSFKYKSTFRNIFRYKVNLVLTIISVAGSTALTFAGFGLFAIAISPNTTEIPISMADSFAIISMVIILFAALLCVLVIFNIANMNVQERKREIATLRVLGYQQNEVSQYIYREINLMTVLGVIVGIPLGYLLLNFLFECLDFGNIQNVNWYFYLITIVVVVLFILIAEVLLISKIRRIDMNASLKSNE